MSDHEPSYYEIALTNRQVLIAFAILLVCLVAAFLSGVWVGRGDAAPSPPRVVEETPVEGGADEPEPLSFFSREAGGAGEAGAGDAEPNRPPGARPSGAEPTLAEELGESVGAGETDRPAAPRSAGGEEAPAAPRGPREEPRTSREPAEPAGSGDFVIQVFSSRDREQAQSIVERLVAGGRDAYLSPVEMDGQTMYRVRIGPFADRERAAEVAEEVRRRFKLDTWITPR